MVKRAETHKKEKKNIEKTFAKEQLLDFYEQMLLIRKFETTIQTSYKKGEVPGFLHLCIGQEAVAVGACKPLRKSDWITSTHRGHGHVLAKGVAVKTVMAELFGKATGCSGGRGGSMHLFSYENGVLGTNGVVGGGIPLAVGLGISEQIKGTDGVGVAFFGDGAVNHGAFHESLGLAAVQRAPVVFVCENNLYATCTPYEMAGNNVSIPTKTAAYGIPAITVDGNDVLAVYAAMNEALERARKGEGPTLIEAMTYRTVGHHEGDVIAGTYRTLEEVEEWKKKCPILRFEQYLLGDAGISREELDKSIAYIDEQIADALAFAKGSPDPDPAMVTEHVFQNPVNPQVALNAQGDEVETSVQGWLAAVRDGIAEEMRRDNNILYFGEGIGERGGSFAHTKNLWQEFGDKRVIDTAINEQAFTGAAAAASAAGCRSIADLMFADFLFEAATQIVNQISKFRYISNGQVSVPVIVRAGAGQIKQAGAQHSGTFHSVWSHIPGLIVVAPSTPADAKGLMKTALRAGDPVIFLEPKSLFSIKGPVPTTEHYVPFGKARVVESGSDITIVTFGLPVYACSVAAKQLRDEGISCEVLDLRTLVPLDMQTILTSIRKTGKLLVVEEAYETCSFSSEIITRVTEVAEGALKRPAARLTQVSVPQPFSPVLESEVGINGIKVKDAVKSVLEGKSLAKRTIVVSGVDDQPEIGALDTVGEETGKTPTDSVSNVAVTDTEVAIIVPNIGLTITEVQIAKWHKKVGDWIEVGDELLDFESDKSVMSLEAEIPGKLVNVIAEEGAEVTIGAVVGYIEPAKS